MNAVATSSADHPRLRTRPNGQVCSPPARVVTAPTVKSASAIANEFGRMTRYEWMTMWESIDPTSVDRERLIGIMCTCCTPDTAANIMQDWMLDAGDGHRAGTPGAPGSGHALQRLRTTWP